MLIENDIENLVLAHVYCSPCLSGDKVGVVCSEHGLCLAQPFPLCILYVYGTVDQWWTLNEGMKVATLTIYSDLQKCDTYSLVNFRNRKAGD